MTSHTQLYYSQPFGKYVKVFVVEIESCIFYTDLVGYQVDERFFQLTPEGILTLQVGFMWNGPNYLPANPLFMPMSGAHDAFTTMMQKRMIPFALFDKVQEEAYKIMMDDHRAMLPEGVIATRNPEIEAVRIALNKDMAWDIADPDQYRPPEILTAPREWEPKELPDDYETAD